MAETAKTAKRGEPATIKSPSKRLNRAAAIHGNRKVSKPRTFLQPHKQYLSCLKTEELKSHNEYHKRKRLPAQFAESTGQELEVDDYIYVTYTINQPEDARTKQTSDSNEDSADDEASETDETTAVNGQTGTQIEILAKVLLKNTENRSLEIHLADGQHIFNYKDKRTGCTDTILYDDIIHIVQKHKDNDKQTEPQKPNTNDDKNPKTQTESPNEQTTHTTPLNEQATQLNEQITQLNQQMKTKTKEHTAAIEQMKKLIEKSEQNIKETTNHYTPHHGHETRRNNQRPTRTVPQRTPKTKAINTTTIPQAIHTQPTSL